MTTDLIGLGRECREDKHFRWMPGMLGRDGDWWGRVIAVWHHDASNTDVVTWHVEDTVPGRTRQWPHTAIPDLADPATLGCLLALVREKWGKSALTLTGGSGEWRVNVCLCGCVGGYAPDLYRDQDVHPTEAAALVAALKAAP
jgi:hypothetical protein